MVSSATCTEGLFAVPHTVCRPSYATLCLSRGATRCEWQGALPITLPLILPLFLIVVFFFTTQCFVLFVSQDKETPRCTALLVFYVPTVYFFWMKRVDCSWHATQFSQWSVKAGQAKRRMIRPLLSVGFLYALSHPNAQ